MLLYAGQQNPDGALHGAADLRHLVRELGDSGGGAGNQTLPHAAGLPEGVARRGRSGGGDICGAAVSVRRGLSYGDRLGAGVDFIQLAIGEFPPVQCYRPHLCRVHFGLHHHHLPADDRAQHRRVETAAQRLSDYTEKNHDPHRPLLGGEFLLGRVSDGFQQRDRSGVQLLQPDV